MRVIIAASFLLTVAQAQSLAPLYGLGLETAHPKEFIVVVESPEFKKQLVMLQGVTILREHNIDKWHAVLVEASQKSVKTIRRLPGVKLMETNHVVHLDDRVETKRPSTSDINPRKSTLENHTIRKNSDPPKEYIVRVKGGKHKLEAVQQRRALDVSAKTYEVVEELHVYALQALVIKMDLESAEKMKNDPDVISVEENIAASLSVEEFAGWEDDGWTTEEPEEWTTEGNMGRCAKQEASGALWGLARITSTDWSIGNLRTEFEYSEMNNGQGVDVYIIDTGIYEDHDDFGGRVTWGYVTKGLRNEGRVDLNGHGTMVASLAAGRVYGVAKKANIIAVKCMDRSGTGSVGDMIEAVEWVHKQINTKKERKHVVNMSFGMGGPNLILEEAIQAAINDGVTFVIAAGNSAEDTCETAPAKVSAAITVAASNSNDELAYFTNAGPCINIVAPGENVIGADIHSPNSTQVHSGTSFAAPYVAGVIGVYLSSLPDTQQPTPQEVKAFITDSALPDVLNFNSSAFNKATPNLLVHMECDKDGVSPTMLPSRNASGECFKQQSGRLNWHLSRISSREKILNYGDRVQYTYSSSDDGADIDVYVMDSGIYLEHSEFEGRAKWGMTANSIYEGNGDLNGHGTHVASLVGGKTNGVAKGVNIIAVKVFDMSGQGSAVNIIEGIAWIAQDVESKRKGRKKRRAVVNMSFGFTRAVNVVEGALTELIAGGTSVVVAAGNSFVSACRICPARMASVTTVGASTIYSTLAWFSNYGSCVDIIAPGDEILGAGIEKPDTRVRQSGTSMAAPIVAGVAARFLSSFEDDERWPTPAEVQTYLIDHGNQNFLDLSNSGTPNVEVYSGISGCENESENGVLCLAAPSLVQLLLVVLVLVKLLK